MRVPYALLQVAIFAVLSSGDWRATADDAQSPAPRFEDSLEPRLPKSPLAGVAVEGNQQIKSEQILKLVKTKAGQVAAMRQIRADVHALLAPGWFSKVETRVDNSKQGAFLVFTVQEKLLLAKFTCKGNQRISEQELGQFAEQSGVKVGMARDVESNREAVRNIEKRYRDAGYLHATVEIEKGSNTDDREVVLKIEEGPQVIVNRISFVGNKAFDGNALQPVLQTSLREVWFSGGTYSRDVVDGDLVALRKFYQDRGYFDARIKHQETISNDRSQVDLEFVVDEGVPFHVRHIEFTGNEHIGLKELRSELLLRKGGRYEQRLVNADKEAILTRYARAGFVLATVEHQVRTFEEAGSFDLIYQVTEGDRFSIPQVREPAKSASPRRQKLRASATVRSKQDPAETEPPGVRDLERLVFTGVEVLDAANMRRALGFDLDTYVAAHPHGTLSNYIAVVQRQILGACQNSGFPDATVEVAFNAVKGQIEVRVVKGRRLNCGEIKVIGLPQDLIESVVEALTVNPKPRQILWEKGEPASFDEFTAARIRRRIEAALAAAGLFAPRFDVDMIQNPDARTVDLTISVQDMGRRAAVRTIEVIGTDRDSADDVLKYLGLHSGMPFDSRLSNRLQRRLWESGRYLETHVSSRYGEPKGAAGNYQVRDLQIKLVEDKTAPPVLQALSPVEKALLKFGEWVEQWSLGKHEEELVVTSSRGPGNDSPPGPRSEFRMVFAPDRGQTVVFDALGADGQSMTQVVFVAYPDRMVLAAPRRFEKIELPNSDGLRLALTIQGATHGASFEGDTATPYWFYLGLKFHRKATLRAAAFGVQADFSPAWILSMAHCEGALSEIRDGVCTVSVNGHTAKVDARSGRLIEYRCENKFDGTVLSVRTENEALQLELERLEPILASSKVAYDQTSLWKSLAAFSLDCWIEAADHEGLRAEGDSVRALRKAVDRWTPPALTELFDVWDDPPTNENCCFVTPQCSAGYSLDDLAQPGSLSRKNLIGFVLPVYRRLVPKSGCLWPVGRDAASSWALGDKLSSECLIETCESSEIGPVGGLLLGIMGTLLSDDLSGKGLHPVNLRERAGFAGMTQLFAGAFRQNYQSLLDEGSWLGRWCISLARAVRTLDDSELDALERFLPANAPRELLVQAVRELKTHPDRPVERVLPGVLDRLWAAGLRAEVSAHLRSFVVEAVLQQNRRQ